MITIGYLKYTSHHPSLKRDNDAFTTDTGEPYEIQPEGSLGLLALGYRGIMAWRKKRLEVLLKESEKTQSSNSTSL